MDRRKAAFHAAALAVVALWATSFVSSKYLIAEIEPSELLILRFVLGYLALFLIERPHAIKKENLKKESVLIVCAIVGNILFFYLQTYALKYTSVGNVSILGALAPLLTGVLNRIFLKKRLGAGFCIGFLFAIAGIVAVEAPSHAIAANPIGDVLAFLSAVCWASYSMILVKVDPSYSPISITRKLFFYSVVLMAPCLMAKRTHVRLETILRPGFYLNVLYLALICSALCYVLWNMSLKELGNKTTMVYLYLQPMISLFAANAFIHENISPSQLIGTILIIIGLVVSQMDRKPL